MPILKRPTTPAAAPANKAPAIGKSLKHDTIPGIAKGSGGDGKSSSKDAFAARYNSTEPSAKGAFTPPPPGQYNALITECQYENDDPKETVYLEATIVDDDAVVGGKDCRIYFNLTDIEGNEGNGMPYLRSALAMLGYPDPIESLTDLQEILAQIAQDQTWVLVEVKKKGKWTNIYLSSVPENQAEKPSLD